MDYVLKHHGIKGQKWGVRRFQNSDGTRTAAGKKRYNTRYVTPDGKYLTPRGKRKSISSMQKELRFAQQVYKVSSKAAKKYSDKAELYLEKANASEKGSKQDERAMKGYAKHIENARRVERGEAAVKEAFSKVEKLKQDKWIDPNSTKSQEYKDAKALIKRYGIATMQDYYTTAGIGKNARSRVLYDIGKKTNKKPKYGYLHGESYLV